MYILYGIFWIWTLRVHIHWYLMVPTHLQKRQDGLLSLYGVVMAFY